MTLTMHYAYFMQNMRTHSTSISVDTCVCGRLMQLRLERNSSLPLLLLLVSWHMLWRAIQLLFPICSFLLGRLLASGFVKPQVTAWLLSLLLPLLLCVFGILMREIVTLLLRP